MTTIIDTPRLILRTWNEADLQAYYAINQDPKVMEHLKGPLTMEQVRAFLSGANTQQEKNGYTIWAVELKETNDLIGFIGLNEVKWTSHFTPAVEIGWRLGSQFWGKGYATEGAKAVLEYGFMQCKLKEIVAFTVPANTRSSHVMEKIGLKHDPKGDFAHPDIEPGHRLSRHILYRLRGEDYLRNR